MWRVWALAVALAATTAAGCTRFGGRRGNANAGEGTGTPVEVTRAVAGTMAETVTVTGTIRARREADIGAQISARVTAVRVREGDRVGQGDVLVTLDRAQYEAQVRQARAAAGAAAAGLEVSRRRLAVLEAGARVEERAIARSRLEQAESALRTAEADLERLRKLFAQGAISKQQLDGAQTAYDIARTNRDSARQSLELTEKGPRPEEIEAARKQVEAAQAGLDQSRAALAQAEEILSYTVIRSPLTGVVYERDVEPGEVTSTMGGPPLLRVADVSSVYYEARVSERKAYHVRPGQRVKVVVQTDGERALEGKVEEVVPVADPGSRDFLVRVDISDSNEATKPGVFARGDVVVAERQETVTVPKDALVEREGKPVVFVVTGGKTEAREVEVGMTDRTTAEILSGVRAGETVVVVGSEGLQGGETVTVRDAEG